MHNIRTIYFHYFLFFPKLCRMLTENGDVARFGKRISENANDKREGGECDEPEVNLATRV